jgi:hypothetical protein
MVEAPEGPEPPEPPGSPTGRPEKPKNRTLEWFSKNPVFGLIGFLIGIVSLAATVYFGWASVKSRDLSLTVNPTRTTIVKAGQSSDLHVLYKGQSVAADVTGLQVGIWNAGRESIRPEHILSPIVLQTSPKVPILEVQLRHTSRPVCSIALDEAQLADGRVGLTWKILEHNDGAVIQLIVAGPSNVTVVGQGSMEGDPAVRFVLSLSQSWFGILVLLVASSIMPVLASTAIRHKEEYFKHLKAGGRLDERECSVLDNRMRLVRVVWWVMAVGIATVLVAAIMSVTSPTPLLFD